LPFIKLHLRYKFFRNTLYYTLLASKSRLKLAGSSQPTGKALMFPIWFYPGLLLALQVFRLPGYKIKDGSGGAVLKEAEFV
jgi:hypothetical protein